MVRPADLEAMIAAFGPGRVAIAHDRAGTGTNALCLPLPISLRLAFGPDSARRHAASCRAAGLSLVRVRRPALALDVDSPCDLKALCGNSHYAFATRSARSAA
jgi:2-phospho-L-lactate guanylyltransferase